MAKQKANTKISIPKGYKVVDTNGQTSSVDWVKTPVVMGEVVEHKVVEIKDKKTKKFKESRLIVVATKDGDEVAVWEKHQLTKLFDSCEVGDNVFIQHIGIKKLPGGKSLHEFACGVK